MRKWPLYQFYVRIKRSRRVYEEKNIHCWGGGGIGSFLELIYHLFSIFISIISIASITGTATCSLSLCDEEEEENLADDDKEKEDGDEEIEELLDIGAAIGTTPV